MVSHGRPGNKSRGKPTSVDYDTWPRLEGPRKRPSQNVVATMTHRPQQRGSLLLLVLLVVASCIVQNAIGEKSRVIRPFRRRNGIQKIWNDSWRRLEEEEEEVVDCQPIGVCEMCTNEDRSLDGNECEKTGRHIQFKCTTTKGEEETGSNVIYKSCDRTEADEEFLMIRLQAICFTVGIVSLFGVRRNKQVGASLFDQRKAAAKEQQQHHSLALTSNGGDQEMVPLKDETDSLDVV